MTSFYEFHCPQFVDFAEIDSSPKDTDEFGGFSPDLGNAVSHLNVRAKSTSRRKVYPDCKRLVPFQQTPVSHSNNATDSDKWHLSALPKRFGASDDCINRSRNLKASDDCSHFPILKSHKRSLSEGDIRAKTRICPTTPVCLKRTLYKAKVKKFKTSEELELEKIAELQKQMHEHLRANEMAMRRLKMRQRPCTAQSEVNGPALKSKDFPQTNVPKVTDNKGLGKLNGLRQNPSRNVVGEGIEPNGSKMARTKRFQTRVNELRAAVCKPLSEKNLNPITGSALDADGWSLLTGKKPKPYAAHPGLFFLPKNRKTTTCEPFNLIGKECRPDPNCTSQRGIPTKDQRHAPGALYNFTGKENNTSQKSFSEVKRIKDQKLRTPFHSKDNRI